MVSSAVYPGLERKPGGPDNWVEAAGGLPSYIERIAKHLHYERGYSISRAIATAVNTVERWKDGGTVTKNGTTKRVTPKTQALAAAAWAEWEAKKGSSHVNLSEHDPEFDAETEQINENKLLPANRKAHKFEAADWTHPNGHPRCIRCGDEERTGGICSPQLDLAAPDISDTQTMVCLRLGPDVANKIAVSGGVPAEELHITLGYFGEVEDVEDVERMVTECVQEYGQPLSGSIGGILAFPPGDQGTPWAATVDIPGLSQLYVKLVDHFRGSDYPISQVHGFTPHVSLTFDDPQDPLEAVPVSFGSVAVVRGNELVAEVPLGSGSSADEPEDGTLSPDTAKPKEGKMEFSALLERASAIADPDLKVAARKRIIDLAISMRERKSAASKGQTIPGTTSFPIRNEQDLKNAIQAFGRAKDPAKAKAHIVSRAKSLGLVKMLPSSWKIDLAHSIIDNVIDLALTKDGRKSFKNQGKWKHGFVPVDDDAVDAKAKGSPIARRRITRLFGGNSRQVNVDRTQSSKTPAFTKRPKAAPHLTVKGANGAKTSASRAALLQNPEIKDATESQRVDPKVKREVSRGRGNTARAIQEWDKIPDNEKVIRNGKKYVVATFAGQQQLTEWAGPGDVGQSKADPSTVRYLTMSPAKAAKFSTAELRHLLAVPGQPKSVREVLNKALRVATAKAQRVA